jgi:beta-fructofuranosidase
MTPDENRRIRQQFASDPHRPRYHFLPPANWINDPNGFIHWQGKLHLFFQHNPNNPFWGDMSWGHAATSDYVHWEDYPVAITPTPNSPDMDGCFSGCVVVHEGVPTMVYTGNRNDQDNGQSQCIAFSYDEMVTWEKYPHNPVLRKIPDEANQNTDQRDPFIWKEGDDWILALGSRVRDVGGAVFLYRSKNLKDWEYLNPLFVGEGEKHLWMWECPNFLRVDDQWVLVVSLHTSRDTDRMYAFVGEYNDYRFTPTSEGMFDYEDLYASVTCTDNQNRPLLIAWLRESRHDPYQRAAGWTGAMCIPRVLGVDGKGRVTMQPVPEIAMQRRAHFHTKTMDTHLVSDVSGGYLDIVLEVEVGADGTCLLEVVCSPDHREKFDIAYDARTQTLITRKIYAEDAHDYRPMVCEAPHPLDEGETLRLRVLLDGSVLEIIANERTSVTRRFYITRPDSQQVHLSLENARLISWDVWEMASIWE